MNFYGDYHTHTFYSDGASSIEANIVAAREKSLQAIAISDHGFFNPPGFSLRYSTAQMQSKRISLLRDDFPDLTIYHAIEADIISTDGEIDLKRNQFGLFDFVTAGFHYFARPRTFGDFTKLYLPAYVSNVIRPSKDVIRRNTRAFTKMIERYPIAILAHLNDGVICDVGDIAKCCADNGTYLELNAKHIDMTYKSFEKILSTDVRLIANSDAHYPARIGCFEQVVEYIAPYPEAVSRIVNAEFKEVKFRK